MAAMNKLDKSIKRLGVTGGRDYENQFRVFTEINEFRKTHIGVTTIVTGDARGSDWCAREYAKTNKLKLDEKKADWSDMSDPCVKKINKHGGYYNALAGFKRNEVIAGSIDFLLCFWDGRSPGTRDMIDRATKKGVPVLVVKVTY
jgi:hypothetical protein